MTGQQAGHLRMGLPRKRPARANKPELGGRRNRNAISSRPGVVGSRLREIEPKAQIDRERRPVDDAIDGSAPPREIHQPVEAIDSLETVVQRSVIRDGQGRMVDVEGFEPKGALCVYKTQERYGRPAGRASQNGAAV